MPSKPLNLLALLFIMSACSHHSPKPMVTSKRPAAWQGFAFKKTNFSGAKRKPASQVKIPGLEAFLEAIKQHPNFSDVPVGSKVVMENDFGASHGKQIETTVYLRQDKRAFFSLTQYDDGPEGDSPLKLESKISLENLLIEPPADVELAEIKKTSPSNFVISYTVKSNDEGKLQCENLVDLTKPYFIEHTCKDSNGKISSQSKLVRVEKINLNDYVNKLKSIKLEVFHDSLVCKPGDGEDCFTSVVDEENKDWSYLLK